MLRSGVMGFGFLAVAVLVAGCSSDSAAPAADNDASTGSGGTSGSGGTKSTGGKTATGGTSSTGGKAGTGGKAATGGTTSTGGSAADASSGGTDSGAGGTPSDSGTGGTDSGPVSGPTCGSSPYAKVWISGSDLNGTNPPTGLITVSAPAACPGTSFTLDPTAAPVNPPTVSAGAKIFNVPNLVPIYFRATQAGAFPGLTQEILPDKSSLLSQAGGFAASLAFLMFPANAPFAILDAAGDAATSWDPATRAVILLSMAKADGATGTCAITSGVTVTVDGHPEATGERGATTIVTGSTSTSGTYIFITTTGTPAAPELVKLTLTKSGCTVKTTGYDVSPGILTTATGNYPIEHGATTWGLAMIGN